MGVVRQQRCDSDVRTRFSAGNIPDGSPRVCVLPEVCSVSSNRRVIPSAWAMGAFSLKCSSSVCSHSIRSSMEDDADCGTDNVVVVDDDVDGDDREEKCWALIRGKPPFTDLSTWERCDLGTWERGRQLVCLFRPKHNLSAHTSLPATHGYD
eukprot:3801257-Rhodomonas_salina.1